MKMADGGFRPAYNCQIATVAGGQIVIAATAVTVGSDRGMIQPMLDWVHRRYGRLPKRHLVDGGSNNNATTEWAATVGRRDLWAAPSSKHRTDPYTRALMTGPASRDGADA